MLKIVIFNVFQFACQSNYWTDFDGISLQIDKAVMQIILFIQSTGITIYHYYPNNFVKIITLFVYYRPVIIEVPIFTASCSEREIVILRSDTGETWQDHYLHNNDNAMIQVLS